MPRTIADDDDPRVVRYRQVRIDRLLGESEEESFRRSLARQEDGGLVPGEVISLTRLLEKMQEGEEAETDPDSARNGEEGLP